MGNALCRGRLLPAMLAVLCLLATACDDDTPSPALPGEKDPFTGVNRRIILDHATEDFTFNDVICSIKAPDGSVITRTGRHGVNGGRSVLDFFNGLRDGEYRLLSLTGLEVVNGDTIRHEYGLGCRVAVSEGDGARILDAYSRVMRLYGEGTEANPFIVSCSDHLKRIRTIANDQTKNNLLFEKTHFLQTVDIDMDKASWDSDHDFGWIAIGNIPNNPFRGIYDGGGYTIDNLWSLRPGSAGIGLFGYTEKAIFKNITMQNPRMEGNFAVGSLVGGAVTGGDSRDKTSLFNCKTGGGYVKASAGSIGAGGLIGSVDLHCVLLMDNCSNESTPVTGAYAVGGLLGAGSLYSQSYIQNCTNSATVTSDYTGAGGMVGSADSLFVMSCINLGEITGSRSYKSSDKDNGGFGTGGIAGGAGVSFIYSSYNRGDITGHTGVGGIIGSTRLGSDELLFNNTLVKSSYNTASVTGHTAVGGICGEAQFGCYAVYNTGDVNADATGAYAGGIVGNSSVAVVHNAINSGKVNAPDAECAGGVVGKATWGAIFACQNFADMNVKARYAGGILGLAGNYTVLNYCFNGGNLVNTGSGPTGGIAGEIGDPREWSVDNIVSCVLGGTECVLGVLGPVIAVAGEAFEEGASATAKVLGKLTHVLHIAESKADWVLMATDALILSEGIYEMVNEEEAKLMESSLEASASQVDSDVRDRMTAMRAGWSFGGDRLPSQINPEVAAAYIANLGSLLEFYEASDDNNTTINFNINHVREERYEQIEEKKHIKEIVQKVIAGTCIVVSATAAIASGFFTAGTTTAVALTAIGTVATIVGGANAIIEGATDFKNNAVIISQCYNAANIRADGTDRVGGIAGHIMQYGVVRDCINSGSYSGGKPKGGGILGRGDAHHSMQRCLGVGMGWSSPVIDSSGSFGDQSENYYYLDPYGFSADYESNKPLTLTEMCNPVSYSGWDFGSARPRWHVTQTSGYFPVPCHSEMETEVEE